MTLQLLKALVFTFSILASNLLHAQSFHVRAVRVGIDPVKSLSWLLQERQSNHQFYFNTIEGYAEVMCFQRVSVVSEFGYAKSHLNKSNGNFDYYSNGKYLRLGLDFELSGKDERVESYIGGRIGLSSYKEHGVLTFSNDYFDSDYIQDLGVNSKSLLWGEVAFTTKYKFNKKTPSGLYFASSFRLKCANYFPPYEKFRSYHIPGFGFNNALSAGINFALFYHFRIKRNYLNEMRYRSRWHISGSKEE